jgi:signal peptidase I
MMGMGAHLRSAIRRSTAVGLMVTVGLVAAWLLLFRPTWLGGPAGYVIVAGVSMEPTFHTGDLAITQRQAEYQVGDVVAFSTEGGVVIHRIVGGDADQGFITQGDNRDQLDLWRPRPDHIVGATWILVPGVGNALAFARQPPVLAALAAAIAFFLAFTAGPVRRRGPGTAPTGTAAAPLAVQGRDPGS